MPEIKLKEAIEQFYTSQSVPIPTSRGSGIYLSRHDIHHILMNIDTSDQGECEIMAFEGGLMARLGGKALLPMLFQIKATIQDNPKLDCERISSAWQAGLNSTLQLSADIELDMDLSLESIREKYNIIPLD